MRAGSITSLVAVLAIAFVSPAAPGSFPTQPGSSSTFAVVVLAELRALRSAATLGEWRAAHPRDDLAADDRRNASPDFWLSAGASFKLPLAVAAAGVAGFGAGLEAKRFVGFYPPPPSPGTPPAPGSDPRRLLDASVPGYLWLETPVPDAAAAARLISETRSAIGRELGAGALNVKLFAFGSAFWRDTTLWRGPGFELALAAVPPRPGKDGQALRVVAVASLPPSDAPLASADPAASQRGHAAWQAGRDERADRLRRRVEEAIVITDVGPGAADVREFLRYVTADPFEESGPAGDPARLVAVLRGWLAAAGALPPPRRAAALFVADQVLQGTLRSFGLSVADRREDPKGAAERKALQALGAQFNYLELGTAWAYTNTWLKEALAVDPEGRAGELAFVTLLEKGFETSGMCGDQGGEGFNTVIARGEAFLRSERGAASSNRVDVLFAVARAYADVVALASGMGYEGHGGAEELKFRGASARARDHALQYYRLALSAENSTVRAAEAWTEAWRLSAGLAPSRTYFYCVYD